MPVTDNRKKAPVRLQDIATDVELSLTTVSLALRNDPTISEATRRRILEAKKRLGYHPLRKRFPIKGARAMGPSHCQNILYCVAGFPAHKTQYADFLNGVMKACAHAKIRIEVRSLDAGQGLEKSGFSFKGIDGVILTGNLTRSLVDTFRDAHPRLLLLGNYPCPEIPSIELDVFGNGEAMAARLAAEGHRHIAHILRFPRNYYERQFLMGLRDGLEARGLSLPANRILRIEDLTDSIVGAAEAIRGMRPPVTAIVSHAANIAMGCLTEIRCQEGGKTSLSGYSVGMISGERDVPGLKLLDVGAERCGILAVRRLCELCDHPPEFPSASVLPFMGWLDGWKPQETDF